MSEQMTSCVREHTSVGSERTDSVRVNRDVASARPWPGLPAALHLGLAEQSEMLITN